MANYHSKSHATDTPKLSNALIVLLGIVGRDGAYCIFGSEELWQPLVGRNPRPININLNATEEVSFAPMEKMPKVLHMGWVSGGQASGSKIAANKMGNTIGFTLGGVAKIFMKVDSLELPGRRAVGLVAVGLAASVLGLMA